MPRGLYVTFHFPKKQAEELEEIRRDLGIESRIGAIRHLIHSAAREIRERTRAHCYLAASHAFAVGQLTEAEMHNALWRADVLYPAQGIIDITCRQPN